MSDKKKFKETGIGKFLLSKIPSVVSKLANSTPVGAVIETLINGSEMSDNDKQIALEKLRIERAEIDGITRRWVSDSHSQSWLTRNVRPLTLATLVCAYVIGWFYGLDTENTKDLLIWTLSGYFGMRSVDKLGIKFNK